MYIYWSILILSFLFVFFFHIYQDKKICLNGRKISSVKQLNFILIILYIVFFIGVRDKVLDTASYIDIFERMPLDFRQMLMIVNQSSSKGFYLIMGIFKIFISDNHYIWLTFLGAISCFCIFKTLYKYSIDISLSLYLFVASCTFTWLLNGIRQFLVVCILFGFIDWLIDGKKIKYIALILVLSTIHNSVLFMIPICLVVSSKEIMNKKMILLIIAMIICIIFSDKLFSLAGEILEKDYSSTLSKDTGSNYLRIIISAVPILIILMTNGFKKNYSSSVCLAINMSLIGVMFYIAATFTSGILVGRMPIYFTIYNLYLLPWVIQNSFKGKWKMAMMLLCMFFYLIYFYYQMEIAWGGLEYISYFLGIF